ncbi:MAG: hypothetical protein ABIP41_05640 [Croceibacterium sp.]
MRQTFSNTVSTGLTFVLGIAIGIWFTPFLVGRIGPESYGLVILSATVVSYAGPLAQSVSTSILRELALARGSGEPGAMHHAVRTGTRHSLRIAAILFAALIPFSLAGPWLLGISTPFRSEASGILFLTGLGFITWLLTAPFAAILYLANRLDLGNFAQALQNVIRVLGAVALLGLVSRNALWVPVATLIGTLCGIGLIAASSHSISRHWIKGAPSSAPFRQLGRIEAGVLIQGIAVMLLCSSELVVVNYLTDEANAGRYAASIQIPVLIRAAMLSLTGLFGPRILTLYTEGDRLGARAASARAVKLIGLIAALPVAVVLATAPIILRVWLGETFVPFSPILALGMVAMMAFVGTMPLYVLTMAAGRVVVPSVIRTVTLVLYVALAVILFYTSNLGLTSIAAGLAVGISACELALMAPYSARVSGGRWYTFLVPFLSVLLALAIAYAASRLLLQLWVPATVFEVCLFGSAVGVVHAGAGLMLMGRSQFGDLMAVFRQGKLAISTRAARATVRSE